MHAGQKKKKKKNKATFLLFSSKSLVTCLQISVLINLHLQGWKKRPCWCFLPPFFYVSATRNPFPPISGGFSSGVICTSSDLLPTLFPLGRRRKTSLYFHPSLPFPMRKRKGEKETARTYPTNIGISRATPMATPLVVISDWDLNLGLH